jgi:hypothetical protein
MAIQYETTYDPNLTGGTYMDFNQSLHNDKEYKKTVVKSVITEDKAAAYNDAIDIALDDFSSIAEAYRHNSIGSEDELKEEFKTFLEEYTVNLINLIKKNQ